ncbi:MAG: ATP-grasp domain-containing protein [Treponemataceae bacterium]
MEKRILILGAGVMQGPAIRFAKERSWETVVVDGDPNAACVALADRFEHIDLKDKEAIEAFARSLNAAGGLHGVMTAGTDFSATVAWVAEKLSLPGIPYEVALDASDKARMRARFRAEGVPSPDFIIVTTVPDAGYSLPFAYPAVVKPVDNMGSRGCRRVDGFDDLRIAVTDALRYSRSGRVIVEEFMEGPEFSVDSLVCNGIVTICGLADRHIFFSPYFIEMGHTIPTNLSADKATELLAVFEKGVRALGIRDGAAKGDIKLTPKGPMIGEIAARLSGGYMSGWTYPYASGVEPTKGALSIAVGEKPTDLEATRTWTCAERAFISIPGIVAEVFGVDAARRAEGVNDLFLRVGSGSLVKFPENNVTKCGNVIASAPTRADAVRFAETAARSVLIRLRPVCPETDKFLAIGPIGTSVFPPDSFSLPAGVRMDSVPEGNADNLPLRGLSSADLSRLRIVSFPDFQSSSSRDYVGRTVFETLDLVRRLVCATLPIVELSDMKSVDMKSVVGEGDALILGRRFWKAVVRGGYQGGAYFIDSLFRRNSEK